MQASRSGSEQSYASSIRISGWEPHRSEFENPRVDIDFSGIDMAGLTPPSQWQRMLADGHGPSSSSAATPSSSSALQLLMTREMARRQQNLATPPSSRSSQQSLQHFAVTAAAGASQMSLPSSSQAPPFVPWHAFPPAHPQPTPLSIDCNMLTQQHLPSPPHTRDSSRSPSLIHMQQQAANRPPKNRQPAVHAAAPSMSSGASSTSTATTTTTKFSRASAGKRHRTSTERKIERKRAENANYIPRPRNSFIIFRTDFVAKHKKEAEAAGVSTAAAVAAKGLPASDNDDDGDVRSLSKQASEVWNRMGEAEKVPWQERAEQEKRDHARKYPNYRYRPTRHNSTQGPQGPGSATASLAVHEEEDSPAPEGMSSSGEAPTTPTSPSREEVQKRRCDLVFDLMRQGYRGAELTSALMVYEGNFMPPNVAECVPMAPPPPPIQPPVNSDSSRMRPPPLMSTPSHPLRFSPSSSSLSCALHMPIPRSPSAPLFNTRPAHDSSLQVLSSSTPRSCPTTPQGRLDDCGSMSDTTSEQPSDTESPVTSASTVNPPPQSMPPSPEENRMNPLDAHSHLGLQNMHNIYSYDKSNDSTHESSIPASRTAPYNLSADFGVPMPSQIPTHQAPSHQALTLPRPPLEMVAELWAQQAAPSTAVAGPSIMAPDPMSSYLSLDYLEQPTLPSTERSIDPSTSQNALLPTHDQVRFLSGLPSPPLSSTGSEQLRLFGSDQDNSALASSSSSSSAAAAAHSAALELEAYHMALGQAYANEVGSSESGFGDYYFDLDLGLGGVLPESTISFSALGSGDAVVDGTSAAAAAVAAARGDLLDVDMDYLTGAEYPYDHTTGHF